MPGAVFIQKCAPLVIGCPRHRSVNQRLCKNQRIPRVHFGLYHIMGYPFILPHILRNAVQKIGLVRAGNTTKPTIAFACRHRKKGHNRQPGSNNTIAVFVPMIALAPIIAPVQSPSLSTFLHKNAVIVINSHFWPQKCQQIRHNLRVIQQLLKRHPPRRGPSHTAIFAIYLFHLLIGNRIQFINFPL